MNTSQLRKRIADNAVDGIAAVAMTADEAISLADQLDRLTAIVDDATAYADERKAIIRAMLADMPTVKQRKCWSCGNIAWHADQRTPYVCCRKCGSQDTRLIKERP